MYYLVINSIDSLTSTLNDLLCVCLFSTRNEVKALCFLEFFSLSHHDEINDERGCSRLLRWARLDVEQAV
jgi:hypothetical protein